MPWSTYPLVPTRSSRRASSKPHKHKAGGKPPPPTDEELTVHCAHAAYRHEKPLVYARFPRKDNVDLCGASSVDPFEARRVAD